MQFFIDTANIKDITEAKSFGILDGVTTNPSLMASENIYGTKNIYDHYRNICNLIEGDVSAEIISSNFDEMIREGEILSDLHPNIVVKIPITENGIKAIKYFSDQGIKTNCTLVFSIGQAILAAKAGATYVSPFIGRLDDYSTDGLMFIKEIRDIYSFYDFDSKILAASIRHPMHINGCAKIGIDVVTSPLHVIKSLFKHPLTNIGIEKFLYDYNSKNS